MEKRKIQFAERLKCNKQLVNEFSRVLIKALTLISAKYPSVEFLHILKSEYSTKSKDGVDYTSVNVDNDSAHYLYSKSFDNIDIPINYNPAPKGENYANITFEYSIRSAGLHEIIMIKYNEQGTIITNYHSTIKELCVDEVVSVLEDMISNYIA